MLNWILEKWPWQVAIGRSSAQPDLYLHRWMLLPKNEYCNVYLHRFGSPDWSADLHDHPFPSVGIILSGSYEEEYTDEPYCGIPETRTLSAGDITYRSRKVAHAIRRLHSDHVWTLFLRGYSKGYLWGFWKEMPVDFRGTIYRHWEESETYIKNNIGDAA